MKLANAALCIVLLASPAVAQTTEDEWRAKALEVYPDLGKKDSPLNTAFLKLYNERKKSNPEFFRNPRWPFLLASDAALPPAPAPTPTPAPAATPVPAVAAQPQPQQRRGGPGPGRGGRGPRGNESLAAMEVPEKNPITPEKVNLGRQLFFTTKLSADHMVSCATCHDPNKAFADGQATAHGVSGMTGTRNTPSIINAGYGQSFFWDGRASSLEEQVLKPILNPKEMGLTEATLQRETGMTSAQVADALASYVRTIRSGDSRYDWYVAGQSEVLTSLEKTGLDIFQNKGRCTRCHRGPNFTDEDFHNTGVAWKNGRFADLGRYTVSEDRRDRGAFKTPTLREIARTAPYMHDGSMATLEDVVEFYSKGGRDNPELDRRMRPIDLTPDEKTALVAFLKTLSGKISEGL